MLSVKCKVLSVIGNLKFMYRQESKVKRLVIILAIVVMGSGLSMWCFDIQTAGVIRLAATAHQLLSCRHRVSLLPSAYDDALRLIGR